jgi:hypothetical protein
MNESPDVGINPLDNIEDILCLNKWLFERIADDEILAEIKGSWHSYTIQFHWRRDMGALLFSCNYDFAIEPEQRGHLHDLIVMINDVMLAGYFNISWEHQIVSYRHTVLLDNEVNPMQLEDIIDIGVAECDRFFPAFSMLMNDNKSAGEAFSSSLLVVAGEA